MTQTGYTYEMLDQSGNVCGSMFSKEALAMAAIPINRACACVQVGVTDHALGNVRTMIPIAPVCLAYGDTAGVIILPVLPPEPCSH